MLTRRHLAALPLLAAPLPARAQDWSPTRPIRIVVGFAAGGATDISTRTIQPKLQSLLGQPIVVDNRPSTRRSTSRPSPWRAAC